ncbi:Hypothetical predicted protein, partial [Olea europaea subsp. europaea]
MACPSNLFLFMIRVKVFHMRLKIGLILVISGAGREGGRKNGFASKLSLERYTRKNFPDVDVNAFFASFSWKIPSKSRMKGKLQNIQVPTLSLMTCCKAGNRVCNSLLATEDSISDVMSCDICCSETSFCRDCCCILCCKTIKM